MKQAPIIVFDLDGTLTESKTPIDQEMADLLCKLLKKKKVAVISGASFSQFESQFISRLPCSSENLSVLPAAGSAFFEYAAEKAEKKCDWNLVYERKLSETQKILIRTAMDAVVKKNADIVPRKSYGERLADIGDGMTFSALGQEAPLSEKEKWDPDHAKRRKLVADLRPFLPGVEISIGGTTSINITAKGADKEHALGAIADHFSVPENRLSTDILYVGDSLFKGGNDYGAIAAGVATKKVSGPDDTKKLIRAILKA